jgi:hypothetical protein
VRNRALLASAALSAFLAGAGTSNACGVCVEDRVAAVYDHAVLEGAYQRGHAVAFLGIDGGRALDAGQARAVRAALAGVAGVERASIRVSPESASCSVAYDPRRATPETVAARASHRLANHGLTLLPLPFGGPARAP